MACKDGDVSVRLDAWFSSVDDAHGDAVLAGLFEGGGDGVGGDDFLVRPPSHLAPMISHAADCHEEKKDEESGCGRPRVATF